MNSFFNTKSKYFLSVYLCSMKIFLLLFIILFTLSCKKENDRHVIKSAPNPFLQQKKLQWNHANDEKIVEVDEKFTSIDVSLDPGVVDSVYKHESKNQFEYRLGDVYRWADNNNLIKTSFYYHLEKFPDSIAANYIQRTEFCYQEAILFDLCLEKTEDRHLPPLNTLVVHLRIGDVIDGPGDIYSSNTHTVEEYLTDSIDDLFSGYKHNYVKPLSYYQGVVNIIKVRGYNVSEVMLIGGFHKTLSSYKKSLQYVSAVKRFFISAGFNVSTRIDYPADDDFLFMANATFFSPSGGGFSKTIMRMVELMGGVIIAP